MADGGSEGGRRREEVKRGDGRKDVGGSEGGWRSEEVKGEEEGRK